MSGTRGRSRCLRCGPTERENRRLRGEAVRLQREKARLEEKVEQLQEALEKARRGGKRQAAPFSKGSAKANPRRPGRKPGKAYGRAAYRPRPDRVDEVVDVPLPECPQCGSEDVKLRRMERQYQTELPPVRPRVTQFNTPVGECPRCGCRVQGRHPRQTSKALGAAASQVGPRAMILAAELNKEMGLSLDKVSRLFLQTFGLSITRGGVYQGLERLARVAEPTYQGLIVQVRRSDVVAADETGWKVGGVLQWLWVFVTASVTVYAIQPGRGFGEAASILGEDFTGRLVRDGWAPYRKFEQATHQSCLNHLLHRCHENLETALRGAARVPHAVKRILKGALALRDRRDQGEISPHGLAVATGRLKKKMDRLLDWSPTDDENRKLLNHLDTEWDALFTFLHHPGLPATNYWAEQAVRGAVANRKVCGGNRTWNGAHTQQILASTLRTSRQRQVDPYPLFTSLLQSPVPMLAEALLSPINRSPPTS